MDEPNYKTQYEMALLHKENAEQKQFAEAEKLRKLAIDRLASYSDLIGRAYALAQDGSVYQALELMRGSFQWAGAALSDLERAHEATRQDVNPFLVSLDELEEHAAKGCKRCGKPLAYPGAIYCGATCSAQAEAGD